MSTAQPPVGPRRRPRAAPAPARPRRRCSPPSGAYVGGDIVAGHARHRHGPRQAHPAVHRRRHQLRDRAQRRRHDPRPRPRRPGRPSRAARSGAACAPPTARSRWSSSTLDGDEPSSSQVIGDVEPRGPVRLRPGRRGRRAGPGRAARRLAAGSCPTRTPPTIAPGAGRPARRRSARSGCSCCTGPTPDADAAECVYLSQRDVRELQFAKAAISTGWTLLLEQLGLEHARRPAGAARRARSAATSPRPRRSGSGWCPKLPVLRIVSAGNVAGEGAKMALLSLRERAGARRAAGGGGLCRALRPPRLQRPVRRPARLPWLRTRPTGRADRVRRASPSPRPRIVERHGWPVDVHPLPPLLHNQPQRIAGEVARAGRGRCGRRTTRSWWGTPTAAPTAPSTRCAASSGCGGWRGCTATTCTPAPSRLEAFFDEQPGTYLLTDFLVRSFARTVVQELGLDRWPELRDDLLRPLHRVVWLAQEPDDRAARAGRGGRRPARPAAHRRRDRRRRASSARCASLPDADRVAADARPGQPVADRAAGRSSSCARPRSRRSG